MNQLLVAGVGAMVIAGGAFATGWRAASNSRDAAELREQRMAEKASAAATAAAVDAIAAIKIQRTTIRQELEREIHYAPVVGSECDISDGVFNTLNQALSPPGVDTAVVP